ncbi:MAG: molybdopterin-dependent oxidoreductase [Pseudomonadota bacterium]
MTRGAKPPSGGPSRTPPGQHLTDKFPVMTAGSPRIAPADDWDLTLSVEAPDGTLTDLARWDYAAIRALPQTEIQVDIHCVTRWSKLDTLWRGVTIDDLLRAAGAEDLVESAPPTPSLPLAYLLSHCEGDFTGNLSLKDALGARAMVALDYAGAPLPEPHGGPARLLAPHLYFWKSAKWLRRLILSPYDRKGFWEKLGYHNRGDPWAEQRYRGLDDFDHRKTLDVELSKKIRDERLRAKRDETGG